MIRGGKVPNEGTGVNGKPLDRNEKRGGYKRGDTVECRRFGRTFNWKLNFGWKHELILMERTRVR